MGPENHDMSTDNTIEFCPSASTAYSKQIVRWKTNGPLIM